MKDCRLYVVHVQTRDYYIGVKQVWVSGGDARYAARHAAESLEHVLAVVVQETGEKVPDELWK